MRKFSDEERAQIREQLVETGRELLLTYGPDKTTVKDITEPVGIAKPTFYQFFDAKSDLYLEIFDREFDEFVDQIRATLDEDDSPQAQLERVFECYVAFGEENEFVQRVFLQGDYRDVLGDITPEKREEIEQKEMDALVPTIETIQRRSNGPIADMEPFTVLGIMGTALGFLVLHRDEIAGHEGDGADTGGFYEHLRGTMITTLARGLTVES